MKSFFTYVAASLFTLAIIGCGGTEENSLATEGADADAFAQYEADLAAANSDAGYDEEPEEETPAQ